MGRLEFPFSKCLKPRITMIILGVPKPLNVFGRLLGVGSGDIQGHHGMHIGKQIPRPAPTEKYEEVASNVN